jgi:hypothetical protein
MTSPIRNTDNPEKEYVSCNICGGIGNQLFQIAITLNYAKKYNKTPIFKNITNLPNQHGFERKTQWSTLFNNKLKVLDEAEFNSINFNIYNEIINNVYIELPKINGNILFNGYFQAYQYISNTYIKKKMQELIYNNEDYMYAAYNKYNDIKKYFNDENDDNYVSMHVRRGDYVYIQNFHNLLDINYYKEAYNIVSVNNKKNIVVFSDDIEWCKNNIKINDKIYFVDINNLCIELILMSFIKHNIIANSSFSWWASFISNYKDKIVVAPKKWFGTSGPIRWNDIYMPNWIVI